MLHITISGLPICQRMTVLCCNYPDQPAALDALVGDGTWGALPYGTHINFVEGPCPYHPLPWRRDPEKVKLMSEPLPVVVMRPAKADGRATCTCGVELTTGEPGVVTCWRCRKSIRIE